MRNKKLAAFTIALLLVILFLHVYAIKGHWYIQYPFLDIILHFLGGAGLALSVLYISKKTNYIIFSTVILGIIWELFEVYFDITGWPISSRGYRVDTSIDVLMDTLGATVVWFISKFNKAKNEHTSDVL